MGRRTATVLLAGFALMGGVHASAQPTDASRADTRLGPFAGTGAIRGQVVAADSGAPVRGADVRALSTDRAENRFTTTDRDGRFELRDLGPGHWTVSASKSGFVTRWFGQRRLSEPARPIELATGETTTTNFLLPRSGVIAGHVYDEFGDPVAGVFVQTLRPRMVRGSRRLMPAGFRSQTDDTGGFRVYGLPAGHYYIGATRSGASPFTYFPGTVAMADAQRITLGSGEESSNINVSLVPRRLVHVSGIVVDAAGAPARDAIVNLTGSADLIATMLAAGTIGLGNSGGAFSIASVPTGSYLLTARVRHDDGDLEEAFLPITVGDDDVTGLAIATRRSVTLAGHIVTENGSTLPQVTGAHVVAQSERDEATTSVASDGTFELTGLIGSWTLGVQDLPESWTVKSIDVNGVDVTDLPTEFAGADGSVSGRIVVTDRVTELTGTVMRSGQAAADTNIVVFSADAGKWKYPSRYIQSTTADQQGRFRIRGLPPDRQYLAAVLAEGEEEDANDPEVLQGLMRQAINFSLAEGERKSLDLRLP